ncbi:MAG: hypothetical protein AB7V48_04295 [Sedimentibacter sp.]
MRKIKIISGVYGYRPAGSKYVEPKRAGDPPFMVDDEKAARLVANKVAVYVDVIIPVTVVDNITDETKLYKTEEKTIIPPVATAIKDNEEDKTVDNITDETKLLTDEITTQERPVYNVDMKAAELREIMDECQLPFKVGMSKADMVAMLDEYFSDNTEDADELDEPPIISAEDSIV